MCPLPVVRHESKTIQAEPSSPKTSCFKSPVPCAIATAGGSLPVREPGQAIDQARQVFSEEEIVEIVSCVAMVGWFNRWNGLMGSELEPMPSEALAHVPWLQDLEV